MKKASLLDKVRTLHAHYHAGDIPTLSQHEVNPGHPKDSRENYLYFTLAPCLNFQRSSPALWQSALKTWDDTATRYLFFPEQVVAAPLEKVRADLGKHKLGLQPNKHTEIWTRISRTLHDKYDSDPRKVLAAGGNDAARVLPYIQKEKRADFPFLSGPKMANYWLYILSQYTDMKLANMGAISIIPDTHVIQCSAQLGLTPANADTAAVAEAWRTLLDGSGLSPVELHPVLWNWSRNNFQPAV